MATWQVVMALWVGRSRAHHQPAEGSVLESHAAHAALPLCIMSVAAFAGALLLGNFRFLSTLEMMEVATGSEGRRWISKLVEMI